LSKFRRCPYCQSSFLPSIYRPQQVVCSQPECQRRRRADYHRKKLATDSEYRQVVRDSQKQWWGEHPHYQKQRRQENPKLVESNRQRQGSPTPHCSPFSCAPVHAPQSRFLICLHPCGFR
jgi:hypothetical protein